MKDCVVTQDIGQLKSGAAKVARVGEVARGGLVVVVVVAVRAIGCLVSARLQY